MNHTIYDSIQEMNEEDDRRNRAYDAHRAAVRNQERKEEQERAVRYWMAGMIATRDPFLAATQEDNEFASSGLVSFTMAILPRLAELLEELDAARAELAQMDALRQAGSPAPALPDPDAPKDA